VPARRILLIAVLLVALAAAGCGDDDGASASKELLLVSQASADVQEFCAVSGSEGAVYDLAYFAMLDAVDELERAYRANKDDKVNLDSERNQDVPVSKVVQDSEERLSKGCGKDGKQQAARLQQALKQQ
jgi:hypothetical protein